MSATLDIVTSLQLEAGWLQRAVLCDGKIYSWGGGVYTPQADDACLRSIAAHIQQHPQLLGDGDVEPSSWLFQTVLTFIKAGLRDVTQVPWNKSIGDSMPSDPGPCISVPGGILYLSSGVADQERLRPHSPDFWTCTQLPVTPDFSATCPKWRKFLVQTFATDPAAIDLVAEMYGYCFWPNCKFERFFGLVGPANSGKSLLLRILLLILGSNNASAVSLQKLSDRFALSEVDGKLANIEFEATFTKKLDTALLKSLVSGEVVPVEYKYRQLESKALSAKFIVATNEMPIFPDTSQGIWRRFCAIPCFNVVPDADRNRQLVDELQAELPAILAWAIRGLLRLIRNQDFTRCELGMRQTAESQLASNPVAQFIEERCTVGSGQRCVRQQLFDVYDGWARVNRFPQMCRSDFYRVVERIVVQPTNAPRDGRGGPRCFAGVGLSQASPSAPAQNQPVGACAARRNILGGDDYA